MEEKIFLKRISPKPYPTKGVYGKDNYKTPATRACILQNAEGFFEVNVWDTNRSGYPWSEESYSQLHKFVRIESVDAAKQWLIDNYGGKWKVI